MLWLLLAMLGVAQAQTAARPALPGTTPAELSLNQTQLQQTCDLDTYWNFTGPDGRRFLALVPNMWETLYQRRLPVHGQGEYRLRLLLPPGLKGQSLKLYSEIVSGDTFRVYVNGKQVGHNGFYPGSSSRVGQFDAFKFEGLPLDIRFVVDNQTLQWSGLLKPIWFGLAADIDKRLYRFHLQRNLVFGAFAFMAFFHLTLYVFHRRDKSMLWFGLLCASTCLYMEFYIVHNLEYLFGDIPLAVSTRLLRLGFYGLVPCFFWYARSLSSEYVSRRFALGISWLNLLLACTLLLPGRLQNPLINLWGIHMVACVLYNLWLMRKYLHNRTIRPFVYSCLLYSATLVNDVLNAGGLLHTGYFTRYGFLAFCVAQSGFLGWRLQKHYTQSLQLRSELQTLNHHLEDLVHARTQDVQTQNEALSQLMSFKEERVEMLVHDLKAPLNVLLNLPEQGADAAGQVSIQAASLRMKTLIESILSVSGTDQKPFDLQLSTQRLHDLVQRVSSVLQPWALSKGIQIANLVASEHWVQVDGLLFERVIQNLLDNAIKHTSFGGEIQISSAIRQNQLLLDILDAGPGMSPEQRQQALEKYQSFGQGEIPRSSGLGLYFCQQVVQAHQGQLELLAGPQGGTLVRLRLPRQAEAAPLALAWTPAQLERLAPWVQQLAALEVYQISELRPLLQQLSALEDAQIQIWLAALARAIKEVDERNYRELIDQVTPAADRR